MKTITLAATCCLCGDVLQNESEQAVITQLQHHMRTYHKEHNDVEWRILTRNVEDWEWTVTVDTNGAANVKHAENVD